MIATYDFIHDAKMMQTTPSNASPWRHVRRFRFPGMTSSSSLSHSSKLIAVVSALILALLPGVGGSPAAADTVGFWTERGATGVNNGQTSSAVDIRDQYGNQDTWTNYVEFIPDAEMHRSVFRIVPEGSGDKLTIELNYRGPSGNESAWQLLLIDDPNQNWVPIWNNTAMPDWVWTGDSIELENADRYVDSNGQVVVIWQSSDAGDATQLDYLKLTRSRAISQPATPTVSLPPFDGDFDYQIGASPQPAANVEIVSRDWHAHEPASGSYNICYVNAFQTQPGNDDRIDTGSGWPNGLVTPLLDDDWDEYVIAFKSAADRQRAAEHVYKMIDHCAEEQFDAVEFDNLDVWTRLGDSVDEFQQHTEYWFGPSEVEAYASLLVDYTHSKGLAAAQKNTAELFDNGAHIRIGFDFAVVEECYAYSECARFAANHNDRIIVVEYEWDAFTGVCTNFGGRFPIVKEDYAVTAINPSSSFC